MTAPALTPRQTRIAVIAAVVVGVLLLVYVFAVLSSGSSAQSGTVVGGVDISGMSEEEAAQAVAEGNAARVDRPLRVKAEGISFRVQPEQAGLTLDASASVAPAFGRTWNPISLLTAPFSSRELPLVAAVDDAALASEVTQLADAVTQAPVEPRIVMRNGQARVREGSPGRELDVEATSEALRAAFLSPRRPIEAPLLSVQPTITPEATEEALALARSATSAPVIVQAGSVTAELTGAEIGDALSFTTEGSTLVPRLNGAKLHAAIDDQLGSIETPGRDATFRIRQGVPQVVSSKVGRGVEDEELASSVASVLGAPAGDRTVTVSVGVREPKLTTAQAASLGINEKISSFTQKYPYAAYRSQNIGQAAERINGTLLMPGETFSLNDTILERTVENGYTTGYVVGEGGVFREDLGGGVSASATTTWTAAFYAGMERVQTVAHSIWISRYEPGLEATVAWGIFDLKFRNDTPNAVFITAGTTPTSMTVSFWGTPKYDKIVAESGLRTNVVPFSKLYNEDPACEPQSGIDGFTITVDRVFYEGGQETRREPITTTYKPAPKVICGEKPKKKGDKNPGKKGQQDAQDGEFPESGASGEPTPGAPPSSSETPADTPADAPADKPKDEATEKPADQPTPKPTRKPTPKPTESDVFSN